MILLYYSHLYNSRYTLIPPYRYAMSLLLGSVLLEDIVLHIFMNCALTCRFSTQGWSSETNKRERMRDGKESTKSNWLSDSAVTHGYNLCRDSASERSYSYLIGPMGAISLEELISLHRLSLSISGLSSCSFSLPPWLNFIRKQVNKVSLARAPECNHIVFQRACCMYTSTPSVA